MTKKEILKIILKKIKKREYSEYEIKKIISKYTSDPNLINEIILLLKEKNLINNERFVRAFIYDKIFLNKWGKEKILFSLKLHKIPEDIINKAFNETISYEEYLKFFQKIAEKKLQSLKKENNQIKKFKIIKYLVSKGVSYEDSEKIINNIFYKTT